MRSQGVYNLTEYIGAFYPGSQLLIERIEADIFDYSTKNYTFNIKKILFLFKNYQNKTKITKTKLSKISQFLIDDIEKNTVSFKSNYDETEQEPTVLPAQYPNLLVNGAGGIAVGMATSIPPHNLGEIIDGTLALIENREIKIKIYEEYRKRTKQPTKKERKKKE